MARRPGRGAKSRRRGGGGALPSRAQVLEYLEANPDVSGPREIARAFGITGKDRFDFKALLRDMKDERREAGGRKGDPDSLPPVGLADIVAADEEGDLWAIAVVHGGSDAGDAAGDDAVPRLKVTGLKRGPAPERLGAGDRILARFVAVTGEDGGETHEARVIRRLERRAAGRLGIVAGAGRAFRIIPVSKRGRASDFPLASSDAKGAEPGDLVSFALEGGRGRGRDPSAKVTSRHGPATSPSTVSLIAIHEAEIPVEFGADALAEAEAATLPGMKGRSDLRDIPLLTIDPADARDHDDAVHAAPDTSAGNKGGWVVTVAIADVAAFVRPGSALDREARTRGNSVYFPDRVVPMLPESLSAGLCSLQEGEDRPVMAVRMVFDAEGRKKSHKFFRAMMRSAASLAYEQVQAAWDGEADAATKPLLKDALKPLWGAYGAVAKARDAREPLALDLPERRIRIDDEGRPIGVETPPRLEAHRLIEEFMIQANVAAAETLDAEKTAHLRRIHDAPAAEKIDALSDFLRSLDLRLAKGQVMQPRHFNHLLRDAAKGPNVEAVHDAVLRSQSQAAYAPVDLGHFGLNLRRYAHFTSPIRRYADIIVHRGLITALGLGNDGLDAATIASLAEIGEAISDAERRAMRAERDTVDRLVAHFLGNRIGATFEGRVTGFVRSGLFVGLAETGADGYVPAASLGDGYYEADEALRALINVDTGAGYRVGDTVEVKLVDADPLRGQINFEMLSEPRALRKPGRGRRGGQARSSAGRSGAGRGRPKLPRPGASRTKRGKKKGR